jgi:hypothetical protein
VPCVAPTRPEPLPRSWPFLSRNLLLRLSVRFFAGRPLQRILVNGLQLRLLSSDLGSTSCGPGAPDSGQCFSRLWVAEETQIEDSFCAAFKAEVDFTAEARRSNLRGIPSPKTKRVRRTRIPTTSLVTARSALSLGFVVESPALSNKRFEMQGEDTSARRDPLKEACLARGVWVNCDQRPRQIDGTR